MLHTQIFQKRILATFVCKKYWVVFVILFLCSLFLLQFYIVEAASNTGGGGIGGSNTGGGGVPGSNTGGPNSLKNPLSVDSFPELIELIFRAAVAIGIPISIFFIVLAGFKLVWAQGNPTQLTAARKNFVYTLFGIGIFIAASIIVNIVVSTLCQVGVQGVGSCS